MWSGWNHLFVSTKSMRSKCLKELGVMREIGVRWRHRMSGSSCAQQVKDRRWAGCRNHCKTGDKVVLDLHVSLKYSLQTAEIILL